MKRTKVIETRKIKAITSDAIKPYGAIIEYPNMSAKGTKRNLWRIVHQSLSSEGWRIAYLVLRDKSLGCLQCHPNTDETFEPIKGKAVILLSSHPEQGAIDAFWLNKPIVVYKGVWHGLVTFTQETHMKIFENNQVETRLFKFTMRLSLEKYFT